MEKSYEMRDKIRLLENKLKGIFRQKLETQNKIEEKVFENIYLSKKLEIVEQNF